MYLLFAEVEVSVTHTDVDTMNYFKIRGKLVFNYFTTESVLFIFYFINKITKASLSNTLSVRHNHTNYWYAITDTRFQV